MAEIGESLREARMRAHIDISEVEEHTKIRAKYLRALENEEWTLVPGPVYVKSFLKTYGDFLGLDSRLLIDEFKRRYERPSEHEARATASTAREGNRRRAPSRIATKIFSPIGVIVVALVVIVVALTLIGTHNSNSSSSATSTITPSSGTTPGGTSPVKHTRTKTLKRAPAKTLRKSKTTGTTPKRTATTAPATYATLSIVPTGAVWVCVENGSGTTLYTGDYSAGEKIQTARGSTLLVGLGTHAETMTVNGKPYTPPGDSPIGLKITPTGVRTLPTLPTCR